MTGMARVLALSDGAAGNENQARALAAALAPQIEVVQLDPRAPWRWFAPRRLPASHHAFGPDFSARLRATWPEIAIGCGRQAALATRLLRSASGGQCRSVQILDPRISPAHFDLVIAPHHDGLVGDNVIQCVGGLNRIDDGWLEQARQRFAQFASLPAPRYALLLGGTTRALKLDRAYWNALVARLSARLRAEGASLMVTSSRRTPDWLRAAARDSFPDIPGAQWHGAQDGPNPYAGFLGWADAIVVTPDSVNLMSEAAATRAPVWSFAPQPIRGKVGHFVEAMHRSGRIRFLGETAASDRIFPLRETARVATQIRARFDWV